MNIENIKIRIDELLENSSNSSGLIGSELYSATISLMATVYGKKSVQLKQYINEIEAIRSKANLSAWIKNINFISTEHLKNLKTEIEMDLIGSLEKTVSGEVLTDFLKLAKSALNEKGDNAKNVASVLAAALFEDTIRRIATVNGIAHEEKLANLLTKLKKANLLKGSQVGIAQSYLNFRNNALHADWSKVDRPEVKSVLAFTEELLLKHFS